MTPKSFALLAAAIMCACAWCACITNVSEAAVQHGSSSSPLWSLSLSAYGQTKTVKVTLAVEDTLSATGDSRLSVTAGTEGSTSAFTVSGGSNVTYKASTSASGLTVRMADGKLYAKGTAAAKDLPVVVTITSAAGQTVAKNVTVDVYSQLVFTSLPTGGAIIYAV